ncbi:MAG: DegT/DnrJ/EryC1/StrS family aminotransferase [Candidatus Stahlbacteria bacterium]|nr:DegT/DnrJ/EryC1/StrS family aminotransferase [Candidatus Stahlbacteria bacterium]
MEDKKIIPLFKPSIGEAEVKALREVFKTGWLGMGPKTAEFEAAFSKYVGTRYGSGTNSCTAALHLALAGSNIGKGDKVLVPSLTFVSTVHAILYVNAIPVFVDIEPDTLCMSVADLEHKCSTCHPSAILAVHYGGHPCDMDEIMSIAKKQGLIVIEDAAHSCGAEYKGRKIGSIGDATCFSFHAVKNLTTGDGGMVTTNRSEIANRLNSLRWLGIDKGTWERTEEAGLAKYSWYYEVKELGYKYQMNDIAAAIGLVQLQKLDKLNARRRHIVEKYNESFKEIKWIETPVEREYVQSAWHNYVIKTHYRDELNLYLKEKGITFQDEVETPIAEKIWTQLLTLPLYPDMTDEELNYIIEWVRKFK